MSTDPLSKAQLSKAQKTLSDALGEAHSLSNCAARRCEEARAELEVDPDERPHEAADGLQAVHKYTVQVIWQLRSIASELDETLTEIENTEGM